MRSITDRARRNVAIAEDELLGDETIGYVRDDGEGDGASGFVGQIVTAGPEEEADYNDARYWVREVDDTSSAETDALVLAPLADGRWLTATNRLELGIGSGGAGTHAIVKAVTGISVPDRFVWVHRQSFKTSGVRWVFESYPGQLQEDWFAFLVSCRNGVCPQGGWYHMDGPGFISQSEPPAC